MTSLHTYYADLHIHIGRTNADEPVKISAARNLTFGNIAHEASARKGIHMIGIIDCHSPGVQQDIMQYLERGEMEEAAGGGVRYQNTVILLGCELEVRELGMAPAHLLVYMPSLESMLQFSSWLKPRMKNMQLSSQRLYSPVQELQEFVVSLGGVLVPAHIFTPYKSVLGSAASRIAELLDPQLTAGVELGLSADSLMAGYISELDSYTILTNSDAHSLAKIGREYNELKLASPCFHEFRQALSRSGGRGVIANYGLNPRLGKYHRTYCEKCGSVLDEEGAAISRCPLCGSHAVVRGVLDRILSIADRTVPRMPEHRPPYRNQVPLEYIPGLGPKTMNKLLERFGTEMNLLHHVSFGELCEAAGEEIARSIVQAREGTLLFESGGGGIYGKVKK